LDGKSFVGELRGHKTQPHLRRASFVIPERWGPREQLGGKKKDWEPPLETKLRTKETYEGLRKCGGAIFSKGGEGTGGGFRAKRKKITSKQQGNVKGVGGGIDEKETDGKIFQVYP